MDIRYSLIIRAQTSAPHFHLYKMAALRVMRCRVVQGKREFFCGESPLTLPPPNFKCEKGSVTADKPPVCPAGGFLRRVIFV